MLWIYKRFINAVSNGEIEEIFNLEKIVPQELHEIIRLNIKIAFHLAAIHGQLNILEYLESKVPNQIQQLAHHDQYQTFLGIIRNGHMHILKYFEEKELSLFQSCTPYHMTRAFSEAASHGHLHILEYFEQKVPYKLQQMIEYNEYASFRNAAQNGYLHILEYLEEKAPYDLENMIAADDFESFYLAAEYGHLHILNYLEEKAPEYLQEMLASYFFHVHENPHLNILRYLEEKAPQDFQENITSNHFSTFRYAAKCGQINSLKFLEEKTTNLLQDMIAAKNYQAFYQAAQNGHLDVLQYLEEKAPEQLQDMIASQNFEAFRHAAQNGYLEVLQYLEEKAPIQLKDMIVIQDFEAFRNAAHNGHLDVLRYLEQKAPEQLQDMIASQNFEAFRNAAKNGHLEVLQYLEENAPEHFQQMILTNHFEAFREAINHNQLDILEYFKEKAPQQLQAMITANEFEAFRKASTNGHLHLLQYLEQEAPEQLQDMIAELDFEAFRNAAKNGHFHILQYLEQRSPQNFHQMIAANQFEAFRESVSYTSIMYYFLNHSNSVALNYAEIHHREYFFHIVPFLKEKCQQLRERKIIFESSHPNMVFDINPDEANYYRIICRYYIRERAAYHQNEFQFLIQIPAIRQQAHIANNELLRLAMTHNNPVIINALLSIDAVRVLAENNDMYRNENRTGIDLNQLAHNRESSLTALTRGENGRLQRAIDKYQPLLNQKTVPSIIGELKQDLKNRYDRKPATYEGLSLPFYKHEFDALNLPEAIKAYYEHKAHTAFRYLSKPNPWMHPQASYVEINPETQERWATFEDYLPLIAMLYEAAKDETSPPIDGYTIDGRIEALIDELAYIGRAHNWDRIRHGKEYDDLEADRPSCFSGTKRRLFQAGRGHELFLILTIEDIKAIIRESFREHISQILKNADLYKQIKTIWNKINDGELLSDEDTNFYAQFNMNQEAIDALIQNTSNQYGENFDNDLKRFLINEFSNPNQLISWAGWINLDNLLAHNQIIHPHGFFNAQIENEYHQDNPSSPKP